MSLLVKQCKTQFYGYESLVSSYQSVKLKWWIGIFFDPLERGKISSSPGTILQSASVIKGNYLSNFLKITAIRHNYPLVESIYPSIPASSSSGSFGLLESGRNMSWTGHQSFAAYSQTTIHYDVNCRIMNVKHLVTMPSHH